MMETIFMYASVAVTAAVLVLNLIAPLTKTDWDNKLLDFLRKFEDILVSTLIPQFRALAATVETKTAEAPAAK